MNGNGVRVSLCVDVRVLLLTHKADDGGGDAKGMFLYSQMQDTERQ